MICKKQIIAGFIFCFTRLNGMESMQEIHPFMHPSVYQSLQIIKDKQLSCLSTDYDDDVIKLEQLNGSIGESDSAIQDARKIFQDHMNQGIWMYGQWGDGKQWKMNTRGGLGLFKVLTEQNTEGKELILQAANENNSSWARYYVALFVLIKKRRIDRFELALKWFKRAHEENPDQIPSHWYRHIMTMAGWEAEPKEDNWMTWFDQQLCKPHKGILSYPLALYARECEDTIGAEMLCLKEAAAHQNAYRDNAIKSLYRYCLPQKDGTMHPDAQEAEDTLRNIASNNSCNLIQKVLKLLEEKRNEMASNNERKTFDVRFRTKNDKNLM